jgi:hypothetical protein
MRAQYALLDTGQAQRYAARSSAAAAVVLWTPLAAT